jgi:putative Ca2+/H+ antiporter (TMEM165/GDT1 family)
MKKIYICIILLFVSIQISIKCLRITKYHDSFQNNFMVREKTLTVNDKVFDEKLNTNINSKLFEILSATGTIFVAGFGDKSFLITTVMATKYQKWMVLFSAITSLTLMGYISVQMGLTLPNYIPTYFIDIAAVLVFLIVGLKMIVDGLRMSKKMEQEKLEEITKEINKTILKENEILAEINKRESDIDTPSMEKNDKRISEALEVFVQTFTLIFLSELGDKSQISTIYLSANSDPHIIFGALTIAQLCLTIIAIFCGNIIADKISEKTLTLIAGSMFLAFGLISLYLTYINDYIIINKAWIDFLERHNSAKHLQKIPNKGELNKLFLKL